MREINYQKRVKLENVFGKLESTNGKKIRAQKLSCFQVGPTTDMQYEGAVLQSIIILVCCVLMIQGVNSKTGQNILLAGSIRAATDGSLR